MRIISFKTMWKVRSAPSAIPEGSVSQTSESFAAQPSTGVNNIGHNPSDSKLTKSIIVFRPDLLKADRSKLVLQPSKTNSKVKRWQLPADGDFGPIHREYRHNPAGAIARLKKERNGEAIAALYHPEIGDIDLVWGQEGTGKSDGYGLSKLVKYHPGVIDALPRILQFMSVVSKTKNRIRLETDDHFVSVRLAWNGAAKTWLLTAFEKEEGRNATNTRTDTISSKSGDDTARSTNVSKGNIGHNPSDSKLTKSIIVFRPDLLKADRSKLVLQPSKMNPKVKRWQLPDSASRVPENAPVIDIKSGVIESTKDALSHAFDHGFYDAPVINKDSGHEIIITKKGIKHTLWGAGSDLLLSVSVLPQMIRDSLYLGSADDAYGNKEIKAHHYYGIHIKINGAVHDVVIDAREMSDGRRYYDHGFEKKTSEGHQSSRLEKAYRPSEDSAAGAAGISETQTPATYALEGHNPNIGHNPSDSKLTKSMIVFRPDLLKAAHLEMKQIPGYTKSDGTVVKPHMKNVLVSDDHDHEKVASGAGSHYQKKAHKVLSKEVDGFHDLSDEHKSHLILHHATDMQQKASASAKVSGWKKKASSGQNPSKAEWSAYSQLDNSKKQALLDHVDEAHGSHDHLQDPGGHEVSPEKQEELGISNQKTNNDQHLDNAIENSESNRKESAPSYKPGNVDVDRIAKKHLNIDSLETQNSDELDFHDVHVGNFHSAMKEAYEKASGGMPVDEDSLDGIAYYMMGIDTLTPQNSDSDDFHDMSVWGIESGLKAAANMGAKAKMLAAKKEGGSSPEQPTEKPSNNPESKKSSPPTVVQSFENKDDGVRVEVQSSGDKFHVLVHNVDSRETLPTVKKFDSKDAAVDYAKNVSAGVPGGNGKTKESAESVDKDGFLPHPNMKDWHAAISSGQVPSVDAHAAALKQSHEEGGSSLMNDAIADVSKTNSKVYDQVAQGHKQYMAHYTSKLGEFDSAAAGNNKKKALEKLEGSDGWDDLLPHEQHEKAHALYKKLQTAASNSAKISTWKKKIKAGKVPTASESALVQKMFEQDSEKAKKLWSSISGVPHETVMNLHSKGLSKTSKSPKIVISSSGINKNPDGSFATPGDEMLSGFLGSQNGGHDIEPEKPAGEEGHGWESDDDNPAFKEPKSGVSSKDRKSESTDLVDGWVSAIQNGVAPTKAQAQALDNLDEDAKQDAKMEALSHHVSDPESDAQMDAGYEKIDKLHKQGLGGSAPKTAADHVQGWMDSVKDGKAPSKAQAEAVNAMDEESKMDHFHEAYQHHADSLGNDRDTDDQIDAAHETAMENVHGLHSAATGEHPSGWSTHDAEDSVSANKEAADQAAASKSADKAATDTAPKDGDTKSENGKTYVLQGGHWHLQSGGDEVDPSKKPSEDEFLAQKHTFHSHVGNSNKQYSVSHVGNHVQKHWGPIGKAGQKKVVSFNSPEQAAAHASKIIQLKKNKGYEHQYGPASVKNSTAKPAKVVMSEPLHQSDGTTDGWKKTGNQKGSNKGGFYNDKNGDSHYVKTPKTQNHVKNEVLAAKLYQLAGIHVPEVNTVTHGGKMSIASKVIDGVSQESAHKLAGLSGAADGFAVDAWLANHDAVGMGNDNLLNDNGKAVRIDVGGALLYRAQGGAKEGFGDEVTELKTMRDSSVNSYSGAVFGHMSDSQIKASAQKVVNLSDKQITDMVMQHGPGAVAKKKALAKTLIARRDNMAKQLGLKAATPKPSKPKFSAAKLSKPLSFMKWGETNNPGPSSLEHINRANHDAVKAIYEAAKSGKPEKIQSLKQPVLNKESGEVSGEKNVLEHPSQHVKGFAQQMLNEIDEQLNPPKKFRLGDGDQLKILHNSYPIVVDIKGHIHKIGKYLKLGDPGSFDTAALGMKPITHESGKLTKSTYAAKAKAAWIKMPQTQQAAIRAYTGSSYGSINSSLWEGNPSGQAQAAAQAMHTLAHDIAPGTILSRKLELSSDLKAQMVKSVGKVLQEPAVGSTSIRPTSWSGNVHLKMTVGPGVKGLWVGKGSANGGAISTHSSEDEMLLPPNTRMLVQKVSAPSSEDKDGFGGGGITIVEVLILPT